MTNFMTIDQIINNQTFNLTQTMISFGWMKAADLRDFCKSNNLPVSRRQNENLQTIRQAFFGVAKLAGVSEREFASWDWKHELENVFFCECCGEFIYGNLYDVRGKDWVVNHARVVCPDCF